MIKKKISMLGSFAVGKTSLVQRFVRSIFSEKYHTTIGVKIDQKIIQINHEEVNLLLWDIHGEDEFQKVKPAYVMGSSGLFIVMDGTRRKTLDIGLELLEMAQKVAGDIPFVVLMNKSDLKESWEITGEEIQELKDKGMEVWLTSAKEDTNVEEAFTSLAKKTLTE
ncbi:MAG: GTP-binding protein [Bacteroidales bacterium]|nr:GTP-binding protein [Bacteroidales bacterium]